MQYTDINGITHVYWAQQVAGDRVFGNGLRAHVDKSGRLISVQGAPVAGLGALARRAPSAKIGRTLAITKAVADARLANPDLRPGATAERVWFLAPGGLRPGWLTYTEPGPAAAYEHVIDAATRRHALPPLDRQLRRLGRRLRARELPGRQRRQSSGGGQHHVNLIKLRLPAAEGANFPKGKYATVWPDLNDDNKRQQERDDPAAEVARSRPARCG